MALLLAAVLLGGGAWSPGDVVLAIVGLWVGAWAWWAQRAGHLPPWRRAEHVLVVALCALAVGQLAPVPFEVWASLPGRSALATDLLGAGANGPRPIGLDRDAAFRALAVTLPALAMFMLVLHVSDRGMHRFVHWWVAAASLAALLGVVQVASAEPVLRFYPFHNREGALGFFAYRNLQATLMVVTLPLGIVLAADACRTRLTGWRALARMGLVSSVPLMAGGAVLTQSRAGAVLMLAALAGGLLLLVAGAWTRQRTRIRLAVLGAVVVAAAILAGAWLGSMPGMQALWLDGRWELYRQVWTVGSHFQPVGAGLGGFEQAFQSAPANLALPGAYMHHAHNDWLEFWVELGWVGVVAAALAGVVVLRAVWRARRRPQRGGDALGVAGCTRVASVCLALLLGHAAVDYPLHATTHLVLFAALSAMVLRAGRKDFGADEVCSGG